LNKSEYSSTFIVIAGLAMATLTGFLRQAAVAYALGAGLVTDIFLVAFALPEFVMIALPIVLAPAFIPLFVQYRQQGNESLAWRFALRAAGAIFLGLLAISALAFFGAPTYVGWLSPGFGPEERSQTILAARLMLPAFWAMGLTTLVSAVLQIYRRFAFPALSTAVYNLVFILTLFYLPIAEPLQRAAWGVTLGSVSALLFQLPVLARHLRSWSLIHPAEIGGQDRTDLSKSIKQMFHLAGPLAAGYGVHHLILFIDRAMATTLGAGSLAALQYSYHLALTVGQLSGLAVATVIFPVLSEQITRHDIDGAKNSITSALRLVAMIAVPASGGLILLRVPLIQVLFERGAFDQLATAAVSVPLIWYAISVVFDALCQPLWRVIYAWRKPWLVFSVNSLQTIVRLGFNLVMIQYFGYIGLAISAAAGLFIQVLVLGLLVHRLFHFQLSAADWQYFKKLTLTTIVALGTAGFLVMVTRDIRPEFTLLLSGGFGTIAYLGMVNYSKFWRRS
jgi:putative peptidoglycan lipid II flippase